MKFSDVFYSTVFVLILGVAAVITFSPSLSALGRLGWLSIPLGMIVGAVSYGLMFILTITFLMQFVSMRVLMEKLSNLYRNFNWPSILIISVMAGLSEELLIRGALQTWFIGVSNPVIGIILASLIFGLLHCVSLAYVVITFAFGMLFGVAYYLSESLVFVMIIHATYNVFAFTVLVKYPWMLGLKRSPNQNIENSHY